MKLGKLNDSRFHVTLAKLIALPMPLKIAFKLKGISTKIQEEAKKLEEVRQVALKQYGTKNEKGELVLKEDNTVVFEKEQLEAFAKELNELGSTDIELGTVSVAELGEKVMLSAEDLLILDGLVIE